MLYARRARNGMLKEARRVDDPHEKAWVNVFFRTEYQQLRRADTHITHQNGLVQIWTQLSVQHVSGLEGVFRTVNVRCAAFSLSDEATRSDMFEPDVQIVWAVRGIDVRRNKIAKVRESHGRLVGYANPRSAVSAVARLRETAASVAVISSKRSRIVFRSISSPVTAGPTHRLGLRL